MAPFNVMITNANSTVGLVFLRQLISLPHPPENIFAVHANEEKFEHLVEIQEFTKHSRVIICKMDMGQPVEDSIGEIKIVVQQTIGDEGIDLLININSLVNNKNDPFSSFILEKHFQEYTVTSLMLFQIMQPMMEAAALRNAKCNRKAVFFNFTKDHSDSFLPLTEVNKVALNLAMNFMSDLVKENNILILSTCLDTEDGAILDTELEKCVASNLLYILYFSQWQNATNPNNCTIYKL